MPVDLNVSRDGRYLYVLTHGTNAVVAFRQLHDGALELVGPFGQLPSSSTGLVAR